MDIFKPSLLAPLLVVGFCIGTLPQRAPGAAAVWDAGSGQTPDQITPPYTLFDVNAAAPTLAGGMLTLTSSAAANDIVGYRHTAAQLSVPADLRIEARVRFDSGSSTETNRAPAGIEFATGAGAINFLWFGQDLIFLNATGDVRGPSAALDTDGAFHTYRVEVTGTGVGSAVNVFYDNGAVPVLTGALFPSVSPAEISWGDLSEAVGGVSQWQHFEHNAAAPEPSSALLLAAAATQLLLTRNRKATLRSRR